LGTDSVPWQWETNIWLFERGYSFIHCYLHRSVLSGVVYVLLHCTYRLQSVFSVFTDVILSLPLIVTRQCRECAVFHIGSVGTNSTQGVYVHVFFSVFVLYCVGRGFQTDYSLGQVILPNICKHWNTENLLH
jgi:hypothetical protein